MKILKYKKSKSDKYTICLEDRDIILYEDTILKFELLLKSDISKELFNDIELYNNKISSYYEGISYIKKKSRSINEVKKYLLKKEYIEDDVEFAINKMITNGYLNDLVLSRGIVHNRMILSNKGPLSIKMELNNLGINKTIIDEVLSDYSIDEQIVKIKKIIEKSINTNRSKSGLYLKRSIYNNLILLGYDNDLVNKYLVNYSFEDVDDIRNKEEIKIRKRLSRKYSGEELEYQVKIKLKLKGF